VVVDDLIPRSPNLVAGANRPGYHLLNVNYGRDYQSAAVADISLARDGDACPACGAALVVRKGIELAAAANLGEAYSRASGAHYLDQTGETHPVVVGRYRLYIDRLIAAVCEAHHDVMGLMWPRALAPYDVYLMTLGKRSPVVEATADSLYAELSAAGARVLYDDRDERAGVKFNDADLLGLALRVAIGERGIAGGVVEVKHRGSGEVVSVPVAELVAYVGALL
jgi:prolyl-tRNA synthetase